MRTASVRMGVVSIAKRTTRLFGCVLIGAGVVLAGCGEKQDTDVEESAALAATPTPGVEAAPTVTSNVAGAQLAGPGGATAIVTFTEEAGGVHVVARIQGAQPGQHGFHVHAGGSCDAPDFTTAGDHFNPGNTPHGGPTSPQHHAGDLGNVEVGADGTGNLDLVTTDLSLGTGNPNDVLGKALILHEKADDLATQPSGNSGARIACGVVQRAQGQAVTEGGTGTAATPAASPVYQ